MNFEGIKLFIIDIDGTVSLGKTLFEGSKDALERIKRSGRRICLFTNNSSLGAEDYLKKLADMGLDISRGELYTSALAATEYIEKYYKNKRIYLLGTQSARKDFVSAGINLVEENPDLVVLTLNPEMTYETLAKACLFIEQGAEWLSTHDDLACPAPGGFLPDAGAFIELIKLTTKKEPAAICGKPYRFAAEQLMDRYNLKAGEIAMIGDRLHADIGFAERSGFYGILVLSGGTSREELNQSNIRPDLVLEKIADIKI